MLANLIDNKSLTKNGEILGRKCKAKLLHAINDVTKSCYDIFRTDCSLHADMRIK